VYLSGSIAMQLEINLDHIPDSWIEWHTVMKCSGTAAFDTRRCVSMFKKQLCNCLEFVYST
jgi:hypothetical protein